jgi:hypothetical protein
MEPARDTTSTDPPGLSSPALWFSRLMWLGIAANIIVAFVSIIWTEAVLGFLRLEQANPLVWPRFAAFLLILLSIFYIPSAINPLIYRYSAVVSILCRLGGVCFFSIVGGRYIVFGLFDLFFGLPQAILLFLAWRSIRAAS